MRLRLLVGWLLISAMCCVTGTVYQRALNLQSNQPDDTEIMKSLESENWKLRCLAARACGQSSDSPCLEKVSSMMYLDSQEEVKSCCLEGLAARCSRGGEHVLIDMFVKEKFLLFPHEAVIETVKKCPSPDALTALANAHADPASPVASQAFTALGISTFMPTEPDGLIKFLDVLLKFPGARKRTEALRERAKSKLLKIEKEAVREKQALDGLVTQIQKSLEEGDMDSADLQIGQLEARGGDSTAVKQLLGKARQQQAINLIAEAKVAAENNQLHDVEELLSRIGRHKGYDESVETELMNLAAKRNEMLSKMAWAKLKKGKMNEVEDLVARMPSSEPQAIDLRHAITKFRDKGLMKAWQSHVMQCSKVLRDKAALDKVTICNKICERAQEDVDVKWSALERDFPAMPDDEQMAQKIRNLCESAECPRCP